MGARKGFGLVKVEQMGLGLNVLDGKLGGRMYSENSMGLGWDVL